MTPQTIVSNKEGLPQWPFLRLWSAVTGVPLRGDEPVAQRNGRPTERLRDAWRAAFGKTLEDQPIVSGGLPTKYLIDAAREAGL